MIRQSNLNDPHLTTLLFAIMVKQCGGIVTITQADIDVVAPKERLLRLATSF